MNIKLKQLRKKLQKSRGDRTFIPNRIISIYITILVIKFTKISAIQITYFSLFVALFGCYLIAIGETWLPTIGVILFWFYSILDSVDGEVARFRKTAGPLGGWVDGSIHPITYSAMFFSTSYWMFKTTLNVNYIFLGSWLVFVVLYEMCMAPEREIYKSKAKKTSASKKHKDLEGNRVSGFEKMVVFYEKCIFFLPKKTKKIFVWLPIYIFQNWGACTVLFIICIFDLFLINQGIITYQESLKKYYLIFYSISLTIIYFINYLIGYSELKNIQ